VVVLLSVFVSPAARAQQPGVQKTLYERLGGLKGITMVTDDFICLYPAEFRVAKEISLFDIVKNAE